MTGRKNDNRIHVRRLLLAAALSGLSLTAQAVAVRGSDVRTGQAVWDSAVNGKSTVIANGSGGVSVMAPYKASNVESSGNVSLNTGKGSAQVNTKTVPVDVSATINKGDIANAAVAAAGCAVGGGGVVGAVTCGGVALAIPIALNWMANAGLRINPDTKELEKKDPTACTVGPCYLWRAWDPRNGNTLSWENSNIEACEKSWPYVVLWIGGGRVTGSPSVSSAVSIACLGILDGKGPTGIFNTARGASRSPDANGWKPASIEDATGLMNNSRIPSGEIVKELDKAGQADKMQPEPGSVTVTGPASITGPTISSVTNNTTNNTTTSNTSTTNNYSYQGGTITNISTVTNTTGSTTTRNPDGSTTTTSTPSTTETVTHGDDVPAKPEEQPVQCDKYPDTVGCAEMDTPEEEIPKRTETITFEAEDVLGSGQCPADVYATLQTLGGQNMKIVDWQTFCGMALPLRALVMALASIMAFFIIMPGGVRE